MGLTNSMYNRIMLSYDEKKQKAHRERMARRGEIYSAIPEYRLLDEETSQTMARKILNRLSSDEPGNAALNGTGISAMENTADSSYNSTVNPASDNTGASSNVSAGILDVADIAARKKALLVSHGYPEDYLEMHYDCMDCRDTGFIGRKKCHCFIQASIDLLYEQGGIRKILESENFSTFSTGFYPADYNDPATGKNASENITYVLSYIHDFCDNFSGDLQGQNIYIFGKAGTGKTFLTHCITKELLDKSYSVIYLSATRLFDVLADSRFHKEEPADVYSSDDLTECDLLIIDDLGSENSNSFTISSLFDLLNERALRGKSIIISSNLDLSRLREIYSERIFSRIAGSYKLLKLYSNRDIRLQKKF